MMKLKKGNKVKTPNGKGVVVKIKKKGWAWFPFMVKLKRSKQRVDFKADQLKKR